MITSLVTYITCYKYENKKILSFGLGKYVVANSIIGRTTLNKRKSNIYFNEYFLVSNELNTKFALKYRISNSGMPENVKFNKKYFIRTTETTQEGKAFVLILDMDSIGINNIPQKEPTSISVIEKMIDGCLICEVRNSESS